MKAEGKVLKILH